MNYIKNHHSLPGRIIITIMLTSAVIPVLITDLWAELYQHLCFPFYKIPIVKRSSYIKIDRHKLKYLGLWQKFYCVYCGYVNGAINYWQEIAGQTEKYWCGIQHRKREGFKSPEHHSRLHFTEYGNQQEFKDTYEKNQN